MNGEECSVLGRIAMDMIVIDITDAKASVGDEAVLIGKSGKEKITAYELASRLGESYYELITRINPLIKRIYI